MHWQSILLMIFVFAFLIIPVLMFIIKTAVREGILEAFDILQNKKNKNDIDD